MTAAATRWMEYATSGAGIVSVEPGIYIAEPSPSAVGEDVYESIGVRIEHCICCEALTTAAPKDPMPRSPYGFSSRQSSTELLRGHHTVEELFMPETEIRPLTETDFEAFAVVVTNAYPTASDLPAERRRLQAEWVSPVCRSHHAPVRSLSRGPATRRHAAP